MPSQEIMAGGPSLARCQSAALTLAATLFVPVLLMGGATAQASEEDPAALIESMSIALKTLNYEGTFVHMQGTNIRSMRILHSSDANGELERMTSLDGEAREVIRNHMKVTCIFPGSDQVVVSKSKPRELLPVVDAALTRNEAYELKLGEVDRVAARDARIVDIRPLDRYRYGYRLWIDRETSMMLRYLLLDDRDMVIEQVLFSEIEYPDSIDPDRFKVDIDDSKVTWVDVADPVALLSGDVPVPSVELSADSAAGNTTSTAVKAEAADTADRVGFESLPKGYEEVGETYRSMPIDTGPISHVMVSDGMASVSVYVEHVAVGEQDTSADGVSTMGAMHAYGMSLPAAYITVVGEVPAATVMSIARSVIIRQ